MVGQTQPPFIFHDGQPITQPAVWHRFVLEYCNGFKSGVFCLSKKHSCLLLPVILCQQAAAYQAKYLFAELRCCEMLLQQVPLGQVTYTLLTSLPDTANANSIQNLQDMDVAAWQAHDRTRFAKM